MRFDLGPRIDGSDGGYSLLRHVLVNHVDRNGVAMEFGVASGTSARIIAEYMPVCGFDSFDGLPEDWREEFPKGTFACDPPEVPGNVHLHKGLFEDSLSEFHWDGMYPVRLLHIDCDLYSSTSTVLTKVMPQIFRQFPHRWHGLCIVFDEFYGYPGANKHEQRAWFEFANEMWDITSDRFSWEVLGHGEQQWAIKIK